jgi:hypothetical protein
MLSASETSKNIKERGEGLLAKDPQQKNVNE